MPYCGIGLTYSSTMPLQIVAMTLFLFHRLHRYKVLQRYMIILARLNQILLSWRYLAASSTRRSLLGMPDSPSVVYAVRLPTWAMFQHLPMTTNVVTRSSAHQQYGDMESLQTSISLQPTRLVLLPMQVMEQRHSTIIQSIHSVSL